MKQYKIILLDVDGTLLDFDKAEEQGIGFLLRTYGVPETEENKEAYHKLNQSYWRRLERGELTRDQVLCLRFEEFFGGFGLSVDGKETNRLFQQSLEQSAFCIEGAHELLKALKGRYRLAVVTNGVAATQYKRLADSGLDSYMDWIFISEEAGSQKPQREFFEYCFERMGRRDVENMLIVGDSLTSDIKGGNTAGIDTCWFNPHEQPNTAGVHVDYEVRSLKELERLLKETEPA